MSSPRPINSREYKVMPNEMGFTERKAGTKACFKELEELAKSAGIQSEGSPDLRERRSILFLDTYDQSLRYSGFVLRKREDEKDGATELTLKYRSPDRYLAAPINLVGREKFEEDIGAPFHSRFSHSGTVPIGKKKGLESLGKVAKLFPGFGKNTVQEAQSAFDCETRGRQRHCCF